MRGLSGSEPTRRCKVRDMHVRRRMFTLNLSVWCNRTLSALDAPLEILRTPRGRRRFGFGFRRCAESLVRIPIYGFTASLPWDGEVGGHHDFSMGSLID